MNPRTIFYCESCDLTVSGDHFQGGECSAASLTVKYECGNCGTRYDNSIAGRFKSHECCRPKTLRPRAGAFLAWREAKAGGMV